MNMDIYGEIRRQHNDGVSIRKIARNLNISRQSVRKYCEGEILPGERKVTEREKTVLTEEVCKFIISCLQSDTTEHQRKQKHTAKRIYDRLTGECGFEGSYSTIRAAVNGIKAQMVPVQADLPLEFDAGEAAQIDWGEATVYLNGEKMVLNIFCARLCCSCDMFVQAYYRQNMEAFLEAQQKMLDWYGGVPKRLIFDNGKVAVKEGFGVCAVPNDRYRAFAAHYAFRTDFCNPASGNEKGLVEGLVGYSRRNFMVPVPRVRSLDELNEKLLQSCMKYRKEHRIENRNQTVSEQYENERLCLQKIPPCRFDTSRTETPVVNDFSTVRFDTNNYSVPVRYTRREVTVKGYANRIEIMYGGKLIAEHDRFYGKGETVYCLEHYIDELERKPRAVFNARPVRRTVQKEIIDLGHKLPGGNHEMLKLLRLCMKFGSDAVLDAAKVLPSGTVPTADTLRMLLHDSDKSVIPDCVVLKEIDIQKSDLEAFDRKCGVADL